MAEKVQYEVKKALVKGNPTVINGKPLIKIVGYIIGRVGSKDGKAYTTEEAAYLALNPGLVNAEPKQRKSKEGDVTVFIVNSVQGESFKDDKFLLKIDDDEGKIRPEFEEKFGRLIKEKASSGRKKANTEETRKQILAALEAKKIKVTLP